MATERSPLVTRIRLEEDSTSDLHRKPQYVINASTSMSTDCEMIESVNIPMKSKTMTTDSASTDYDPFTASLSSSPADLKDLLQNLERATALVRKNMTMQDEQPQQRRRKALIPHWMTSYLLLITFIWQATNLGVLEVIYHVSVHNSTVESDLNLASNIIMTIFQFVHLLLVFFISVKLVKQVIHRTASGSLLAQSYLSTVLLFAGLYTLVYRFSKGNGWVIGRGSDHPDHIEEPLELFLRMFYLSVSTATLCGTSQVEPVVWYASILVSLQMLSSFVYFASILSLGVVQRRRSKYDPPPTPGQWRSLTSKLRRCIFKEED